MGNLKGFGAPHYDDRFEHIREDPIDPIPSQHTQVVKYYTRLFH